MPSKIAKQIQVTFKSTEEFEKFNSNLNKKIKQNPDVKSISDLIKKIINQD